MDITQLLLSIMFLSITAVFTIIGVWLLMVLRDAKEVIVKTNSILTDAQSVTSSIKAPISSFSEFMIGLKNGLQFVNQLIDQIPKSKKHAKNQD